MGEVRGQISLGCGIPNALAKTQLADKDTDTHKMRCRYNQQTMAKANHQLLEINLDFMTYLES